MRLRRFMSDFSRDTNGVAAMVMALVTTVIVGFTAMAVDFGSVFLQTRRLQGTADIAAMVAANDPTRAQAAAEAAVRDNIRSTVVTEAVAGTYQPASGVAPDSRFTATSVNPDAARVTLTADAELYFAPVILGKNHFRISRTATAARPVLASFTIGTRLAALNGGVANALLSALTGSSISLSVMDYETLASARVDLAQYARALKTRADVDAASFDDMLDSSVDTDDALAAMADVLTTQGQSSAASLMRAISGASHNGAIPFQHIGILSLEFHVDKLSRPLL